MSRKIAIVGASGLVGRTMARVLEERNFPLDHLSLFASKRSAGEKINFRGKKIAIRELREDSFTGIDIALFSAGKSVSKKFAPIAAESNCVAIDNSSAWRLDPEVPLIVPEVNPHAINSHKGIIANPNCSTIQMLVALKPLENDFGLKRVIVSTYQSISGAGQKGVDKLKTEINQDYPLDPKNAIAYNTIFHEFSEDGRTEEELKMIRETRKIMSKPDLAIDVTCVRLPILGGHGESILVELEKDADVDLIKKSLTEFEGIVLEDNPGEGIFPTVLSAENTDPVYVGRIRKDLSGKNSYWLWVVADNLRKGAATNAVQIAELLINK